MIISNANRTVISTYLVILVITTGFFGLLDFDGTFNNSSAEAATTFYVGGTGPGNYSKIQDAINNASTGDTIYVWEGIYFENIIINKGVSLIGNGTGNTTIHGDGTADVVNITADWANITGFTLISTTSNYVGIKLYDVQNCTIESNNCSDNNYGMFLHFSSYNNIINNNCSNNNFGMCLNYSSWNNIKYNTWSFNTWEGLQLQRAFHNTIVNNNCFNNTWQGVLSEFSSYNKLINNSFFNNTWCGIYIRYFTNCILINNTCSYNFYGIVIRMSSNHKLYNNTCSDNREWGIFIYISSKNTLVNNTSINNRNFGLRLQDSSNNTVMDNNCSKNRMDGIYCGNSNWNTFVNNTCLGNLRDGIHFNRSKHNTLINFTCSNNINGITLIDYSDTNTIVNSTCLDNKESGIRSIESNYNDYINNTCSGNNQNGITLNLSKSNTLLNNTCWYNQENGIYLKNSLGSTIKDNSMMECGLFIYGSTLTEFLHTIDKTNTVNGKVLYYYKNQAGLLETSNSGEIILANCNNCTIGEELVHNDGSVGVELAYSSDIYIKNLSCSNNNYGAYFFSTSDIIFDNCSIFSNLKRDLHFDSGSKSTTVINSSYGSIYFKEQTTKLIVKNYLHIRVNDSINFPIAGVDVSVKDNNNLVYATSSYGGTDPKTNAFGQIKWILITDKIYYGNLVAIKNITTVEGNYNTRIIRNYKTDINMSTSHFEYFYLNLLPDITLLESPINNSMINDSTPRLKWKAGSDKDGDLLSYVIQIDELGGDWTSLIASYQTNIGDLAWEVSTSLADDNSFQWRVCANDGYENGSWSEVWQFIIDSDAPFSKKPSGHCIFNNTGTINWTWQPSSDTGSGITGYYVYIGTTPSSNDILDGEWTTNTWFNKSGLSDGVTYYCRIRTKNGMNTIGSYSAASSGITVDLGVPVGKKPNANCKFNNTGTINWTWAPSLDTGSGIVGYYVEITTGTGLVKVSGAWNVHPWFELNGLEHGETFYCKIKAKNGAGTVGAYGDKSSRVLVDLLPPEAPIGLTVNPGAWTNNKLFSLSWTNPYDITGIVGAYYKLSNKPTSNFDGIYISKSNINNIDPISIAKDGIHQVYVWLKDSAGNVHYKNIGTTTLYYDGSAPASPFNITVSPQEWSSVNSFNINWSTPFDLSGVKTGAYYQIDMVPPKSQRDGTWVSNKSFTITDVPEGENNIYIWLEDEAGNSNYLNYNSSVLKLDTSPPKIKHTPITTDILGSEPVLVSEIEEGSEITITATVIDELSGVSEVELYYKKPSGIFYYSVLMENSGNIYTATIDSSQVTADGLEYYLKATDKSNPSNIIYFGITGETSTKPTSLTDININITRKVEPTIPTILHKSPTGSNVSINVTITLMFSKPMNITEVESAFSITPPVMGTFTWKNNNLTFTPTQPLGYSKTYWVTLTKYAMDLEGNTLAADISWSFTTAKKADEIIPEPPKIETPGDSGDDSSFIYVISAVIVIVVVLVFLIIYIRFRKEQAMVSPVQKKSKDSKKSLDRLKFGSLVKSEDKGGRNKKIAK